MGKIAILFSFLWLTLVPGAAQALTPPWSEQELKSAADAIVEGVAQSPLTCYEKEEKGECADTARYTIPFKVVKIHKGREHLKVGDTITVRFWFNFYKQGCVGDQGARLLPGEEGHYYLKKVSAEPPIQWAPVHWSGAHEKVSGNGELPRCP